MARSKTLVSRSGICNGNNTHFFKVLMSGFKRKLYIPKAYTKRSLGGGTNYRHAILNTRMGKSWKVKVNRETEGGLCFEKGWDGFVRDHDLSLGDFVVFEHKGHMVFNVLLFGTNACEKGYNPCSVKAPTRNKIVKNEFKSHDVKPILKRQDPFQAAEAYTSPHPHFFTRIFAEHLRGKRQFHIPIKFAKANELCYIKSTVTLRYLGKESYTVNLSYRTTGPRVRVTLGKGVTRFLLCNDVQVGDLCVMELDPIERSRNEIVFNVFVLKG